MPLNLASPGIVVREVDLTVGRVDTASEKVGAIVGPFAKGAVNVPILVENEQDLLNNFGEPSPTDKHYEYWLTASSYLSYGGPLRVVRADDNDLKNANDAGASVKIKSLDNYNDLGYDTNTISGVTIVARNPGSWANNLKVATIDAKADQILSFGTLPTNIAVGYGVTQNVPADTVLAGAGTTSKLDGHFKGIVTGVDATAKTVEVKFLNHVTAAGVSTVVDYQPNGIYKFAAGSVAIHTSGQSSSYLQITATNNEDWFDQQTITLTDSTVNWNNIAERPGTSTFAAGRGSRFDEIHVVVIDDEGKVTGNVGTILEKHLSLSKAKDAEYSLGSPSNWRKFIASNSTTIFGGSNPAGITTTGYSSGFTPQADYNWDQNAQGIIFGGSGSQTYTLSGGKNYDGGSDDTATGAFQVTLSGLVAGYELFEDNNLYAADFLIMGSANHEKETAQSLANKLISVAEIRKDAIAFISPYRKAFLNDSVAGSVTVNSDAAITDNVIGFYAPVTSTTYAVFDSGYKYMYDRFADTFRYVPLNGDIAGTCARNDINNFPWFSPAGTARGGILNAVKLAYNPSQVQRDRLYSNRVNPVVFSPSGGIVLFGDKTGFAKASAFDRINVRRLFIYLENAISAAARDQMFEFNDEITRTNFINIVEPFLRDVQGKRGIFDFRVICDETNNTAAVIDNNEFVADIFIKPARSINFIGLTFVATRTGVSFDEVIGNV